MQAIQSPWIQIQILDFALQFLKRNTKNQQLQTIFFVFRRDCHFSLSMIVVKSTLSPGSSLEEKHIQMPYRLKFPRLASSILVVHLVHLRQSPFNIGVLGCTFKYQTLEKQSIKHFLAKKLLKFLVETCKETQGGSSTKKSLEILEDLNFYLNGSKSISVQCQCYTYILMCIQALRLRCLFFLYFCFTLQSLQVAPWI